MFGGNLDLALEWLFLKQQMLFLRKIVLPTVDGHLRQDVYVDDGLDPQIGRFVRKVSRS